MVDHQELTPFAVWLKARNIKGNEAATALKVSQSKLSKVLNGKLRIDPELIKAIYEFTGGAIDANALHGLPPAVTLGPKPRADDRLADAEMRDLLPKRPRPLKPRVRAQVIKLPPRRK